jgi:agmatinase
MNKKEGLSFTFLGQDYSFEGADVVVIPVPFEGTVSYSLGTKFGPEEIINASWQIESFDFELGKEIIDDVKICTLPSIKIISKKPEKVIDQVYIKTKYALVNNKFPIILGGEHSITVGAIKAINEQIDNVTVIQIDAHADLREEYERSKYSHACVGKRIYDMGNKLVQIGIRSVSKEEHILIKTNKKIFTFKTPFRLEHINEILSKCSDNVYITIDADGFDPSIVPAVGTPVPGGLTWYDSLELFRTLFKKKNIVGFDFVELTKSKETRSADLAATLIYRLIGYKFVK